MSKLETIKAKLAAILAQFSVVKTDKAVLEYDGEDLVAGMAVYVTNEEGERKPAEDGEYVTEDSKVIVVKNGEVESITDPVAEIDAEEEPKPEDAPEGTEEKTGEDAPKEEEMEEEPKETTEDAIAKIREEINELYKLVDSILEKIGETRDEADARLKKLEQMSAAVPAVKEIEKTAEVKLTATSDKRAKRLAELSKDWRNM
jgi:hypothetical protein